MNFDIETTNSKQLLKYLKVVHNNQFIYHLLIMINSNELGIDE